nr:uncharacterized protein LOC113392093 [Vanessa tameamea]
MTRNQKINSKENVTKIIFKNSMNTLRTSKTYSGASEIYTRSLLLQLKRNLPKDKYYKDNGTVKRDLSIETDICILRRYYKKRRNRFLNREAMSAKSKYSINQTEIDTIDEFKHDTSACGDSEQNVNPANKHLNINLTSLVIDNLKDLLNDWIKTYLLEKRETKQKVDTVLDSILHKLELQTKEEDTSSSCTYTVDIEVGRCNRNKRTELQSKELKNVTLQATKLTEEASVLSIPLNGKYLRIISTLSLPRNAQKIKRGRKSRHNMKRFRHKKIFLSISKSSNYIFQSSNLDFLTLPTKSFTKHCVTYDHDANIKFKNFIMPKSSSDTNDYIVDSTCKESNQSIRNVKTNRTYSNSHNIKSFYENIYSDTSNRNNNDAEKAVKLNDNINKDICKSPNEEDQSDPLITIDLITHSYENLDKNKQSNLNLKASKRAKNLKAKFRGKKTLLKHFQSIIRYFSSCEGKKDIKVDIHVNVFPSKENKKDHFNDLDKNENKTAHCDLLVYTNNEKIRDARDVTSCDKQNIISLLDGAASQVKYIISRETSTDISEINNKIETEINPLNAKHSKIAQEINELKIILKSLATTAEKLANGRLHKQNVHKEILNNTGIDVSTTNKPDMQTVNTSISNIIKSSKSVQFSNKPKSEIVSGIKIKKGPKHKHSSNFNANLVKKNTSYNIIDSESIIKVTDMTLAPQGCTESTVDEAVSCSLPISKSVFKFEIGPEKNKLLAYYCDEEKMHNICQHHNPYRSISNGNRCQKVKQFCMLSKYNQDIGCNYEPEFTPTNDDCELCDNSSSSICIDIDSNSFDRKLTIRHNSGMGFWEGCFYCLLLWIPLLLVSWLFYVHVIRDLLRQKNDLLRKFSLGARFKPNTPSADFPIPLADLGF